MHDVSICIPSYNGLFRLEHCVRSVVELTSKSIDYEIVFCDDGSRQKESRSNAQAIFDLYKGKVPMKFIQHDTNRGITRSWNDLVKNADSPIIALLNDDILVVKNWLDSALYFMRNNEGIGEIGFPTWFISREDMPKYFTNNYYLPPRTPHAIRKHLSAPEIEEALRSENGLNVPGRCACPVGCCFVFTKKAWSEIKWEDGTCGFPEWLTSMYEDFTFAYELLLRNYKNYMLRAPRLYHCLGNTFCSNPELEGGARVIESRTRYTMRYGGDTRDTMDKVHEKQMKERQTRPIIKYLDMNMQQQERVEE